MKNTPLITATAVASLFAFMLPSAFAIPKSYTIADWTASTGPAFTINVLPEPGAFILDDSQSQTFDFFTVTANEQSNSAFEGTIDFSDPSVQVFFNGNSNYVAATNSLAVFPNTIDDIILSDRTFRIRLSSFTGQGPSATVTATITQIASSGTPAVVPDAASTLMLLGIGLSTIAFARRLNSTPLGT